MVPLGWISGVVGLIAATAISLYANTLIAKLHELGGKRHIRYRDLAGFVYGMRRDQTKGVLALPPFHYPFLMAFFLQVGGLMLLHGDCSMSIFS